MRARALERVYAQLGKATAIQVRVPQNVPLAATASRAALYKVVRAPAQNTTRSQVALAILTGILACVALPAGDEALVQPHHPVGFDATGIPGKCVGDASQCVCPETMLPLVETMCELRLIIMRSPLPMLAVSCAVRWILTRTNAASTVLGCPCRLPDFRWQSGRAKDSTGRPSSPRGRQLWNLTGVAGRWQRGGGTPCGLWLFFSCCKC